MMAVETFVYLYIIGFGLATVIAIALLITAAKRISREEPDSPAHIEPGRHMAGETMESFSDDQ